MSNNNMTPTPWTDYIQPVRGETIRTINHGHQTRIAEMHFNGNAAEYEANTKAIVSAVNATYGNGINPEAVKDLYDALQMALPYIQGAYECAFPDQDLNESILFQAKAAIDKAKL